MTDAEKEQSKKLINIDFDTEKKNPIKDFTIGGLGIFSLLYLFNLTFGGLEFIPDTLPIVGNIDEFTAVVLLANALKYFDIIDLTSIFKRNSASGTNN